MLTVGLLLQWALWAATPLPNLSRVEPLGGQAGTTVAVEFVGKDFGAVTGVRFDTADLEWLGAEESDAKSVKGTIRIAPGAALGPHRIQLLTAAGPTNTRLFNVHEFPALREVEPKQTIALQPQVIHGYLKGLADQDFYTFEARQGERWLFDLQSIERGGFLECSLWLYDEAGRELTYSEDQDEYLETPRLAVTFPKDGTYTLKVDQYRGPQGVSCDDNCGYQLQVSQLPVVSGMHPLGARPGQTYRVRISGEALEHTTGAYVRRSRGAEHYRLTFPYSMPVDGSDGGLLRVEATEVKASAKQVEASFVLPPEARPGLWRLFLVTKHGTAEAMSFEVDTDASSIDGLLTEKANRHTVQLTAGRPLHAWTLATQLGLPAIDTVLELWSAEGKLLAEHDDLMSGQGTVIGNPDSSLYYLPERTEAATLLVRDRTDRSGAAYSYRVHIASEAPSFQLLYEPEEATAVAGGEAEIEALLIKHPGFEKAVDVWVEGHPEAKGQFRADMHFGPSGDGDNINIPVVKLKLKLPAEAKGDYPVRLRGRAADGSGPVVEALSTLWIGPDGKRNDTRRPLPQPSIYVRTPDAR
ncbi:MAG: hypothetical protein JNK87_05835 [Bryobacterales bacterium]|nr:hypothetical protein [Bryobacterales bacterium]